MIHPMDYIDAQVHALLSRNLLPINCHQRMLDRLIAALQSLCILRHYWCVECGVRTQFGHPHLPRQVRDMIFALLETRCSQGDSCKIVRGAQIMTSIVR